MKKMKRILSAAMALLLMATLPVTAFAEEYNIDEGSITVSADSTGQYVTQVGGVQNYQQTTETVITQTDSSTATTNTVTINAESGATAEVTLDGVNIDASNTGEAAVSTTGYGDVNIELDNENTIKSANDTAGLEKNNTGELTITDEDNDDGSLNAQGGGHGAGIGGSFQKDGSNITIIGGNVTAKGGDCGAGIGGGALGKGSNIRIWGDTQVTAAQSSDDIAIGFGASIGNGGTWNRYDAGIGEEVTPDTSELTAEGSVNGASGNHVHTWDEGTVTVEPTCAEAGAMTYTCIAGKGFTKTEEIPATGEHTWENGKCSVCGEPQPAPTPVLTESDTQSAPLYRVTDKDGKNISYKAEQNDGVLTITVDADFAILTGTLSGINTLKAQGVEKIVFVTKDAISTFALADLLEKGSMSDTYKLTHDGKTVTFTLGAKNTDVSDILEKA